MLDCEGGAWAKVAGWLVIQRAIQYIYICLYFSAKGPSKLNNIELSRLDLKLSVVRTKLCFPLGARSGGSSETQPQRHQEGAARGS